MLGKVKRTLKERCPECRKVLQTRVYEEETIIDGISVTIPVEYIRCSNPSCFYEKKIEQKRKRQEDYYGDTNRYKRQETK